MVTSLRLASASISMPSRGKDTLPRAFITMVDDSLQSAAAGSPRSKSGTPFHGWLPLMWDVTFYDAAFHYHIARCAAAQRCRLGSQRGAAWVFMIQGNGRRLPLHFPFPRPSTPIPSLPLPSLPDSSSISLASWPTQHVPCTHVLSSSSSRLPMYVPPCTFFTIHVPFIPFPGIEHQDSFMYLHSFICRCVDIWCLRHITVAPSEAFYLLTRCLDGTESSRRCL